MARISAYHFFLSQAGYSHGSDETVIQGRRRCAKQLAAAERWAADNGLMYVWLDDPDCTADQFEFEEDKQHVREHGAVGCVLYQPCADHGVECKHARVLGALWGITESLDNRARDSSRRVVEAELACEAVGTL